MRRKLLLLSAAGIAIVCIAVPRLRGSGARHAPIETSETEAEAGEEAEELRLALQEREAVFPTPSSEVIAQWDGIRASEAARWSQLLPGGGQLASQRGHSSFAVDPHDVQVPWINIGPTDLLRNWNGSIYEGFDSGRSVDVVVDPRDSNVVYNATCEGGIWRTDDFVSAYPKPHWRSITDGLPDLNIGSFALDPAHPDTMYAATGDVFESHSGVNIYKSTDGGATWQDPVSLAASFSFLAGPLRPNNARDLVVDPGNPDIVMVATNLGLFRSTDAGAHFTRSDLPNGPRALTESTWSFAHIGGSSWLLTGISACAVFPFPDASNPLRGLSLPPGHGRSREIRPTQSNPLANCPLGNLGDIWRTSDSGATWTSSRFPASGPSLLPELPASSNQVARITIAAGHASNPATTTVYAYVGNSEDPLDSAGKPHRTAAFWRSRDGGLTWADATGRLLNPTVESQFCSDMNVGHGQTWYNQAIGVDPTNDDNVIVGGNLCGMRTLNGTSASPEWENVSVWISTYSGSFGGTGRLPYAHADWHGITMLPVAGKTRVLVANDGGVYSTTNVFDPGVEPPDVDWKGHNVGIVTHLAYAIGSGDPLTSNGFQALMGLQDNGTWSRALGWLYGQNGLQYSQNWPTTFMGVHGGDGIGSALSTGTATNSAGEHVDTWFVSVSGGYTACDFAFLDCLDGANYFDATPPSVKAHTDGAPFYVYYASVPTDPTGLTTLTSSNRQVWRSQVTGALVPGEGGAQVLAAPLVQATAQTLQWVPASPDFKTVPAGAASTVSRPFAARKLANVSGAALVVQVASNATAVTTPPPPPFVVNSDGTANPASWTFARPLPADAAGHALDAGGRYLPSAAGTMDFPNAVSPGKQPGDEYVVTTNATFMSDRITPIPDEVGHIFRTSDRGQTWTPMHGADPATALPNVPLFMVKFDPMDPTSSTIYVGTMIGVYVTTDGGATWSRFGAGLPMVRVTDLYVAANDEFLRIATYGRGLWEINPSASAPHGAIGNGDIDLNQQIDWRDLGALASRLGTTPATTALPRYSYICDLTLPPAQTQEGAALARIKEADLSALVTKFAEHP